MGHLYHGYVSHNQMVTFRQETDATASSVLNSPWRRRTTTEGVTKLGAEYHDQSRVVDHAYY